MTSDTELDCDLDAGKQSGGISESFRPEFERRNTHESTDSEGRRHEVRDCSHHDRTNNRRQDFHVLFGRRHGRRSLRRLARLDRPCRRHLGIQTSAV